MTLCQESRPDTAILITYKKGNPAFVEVKFRRKSELHKCDYEKFYKIDRLWSARVIIVNCQEQPYFRVSDPTYFDKNKNSIQKPLLKETSWEIDQELYDTYEDLVYRYLTLSVFPPENIDLPRAVSCGRS